MYAIMILLVAVGFVIWSTAHKKLNPFFALALAALGVGLLSGIALDEVVRQMKAGFGHTMEKVGVLIILGTTLGILLEKTGATVSMAEYILKKVSEKNAPLGIALTGYIIGFPIFCDSGFIVLNGINHSIVKRTHWTMIVMATALGTSLYAVHCLVPPHPGITVAVETVGGDFGTIILVGALLSVPAAAVGLLYAYWGGKRVADDYTRPVEDDEEISVRRKLPHVGLSFIPVVLPVLLIGSGASVKLLMDTAAGIGPIGHAVMFIGDPIIALGIGVVAALFLLKKEDKGQLSHWMTEGVEKAGGILAIIGAGGMFGEILQRSGVAGDLGNMLTGASLGVFFPFLIAAFLKTAQGSSTVAVITAAALVTPLLKDLGLDTSLEITMAILSLGAGSMCVSHTNDAYFWVINRFSNLSTASTLKVYSVATLLMGVVTQLLIWAILLVF
ncbi:GntP family permease [Sphingobacterium sp. SGG-5]|uniref:GntP family permease n=1 Tax=Sphingobacterium sp. SGG-5 TaxID=2710881 RepID=UPI0013EA6128|nr:GntP family permease [Sphingobacterium sp. SGG-5]NGM60829.1 GntP family permease [Sphingobacterium sp. SGG-5]